MKKNIKRILFVCLMLSFFFVKMNPVIAKETKQCKYNFEAWAGIKTQAIITLTSEMEPSATKPTVEQSLKIKRVGGGNYFVLVYLKSEAFLNNENELICPGNDKLVIDTGDDITYYCKKAKKKKSIDLSKCKDDKTSDAFNNGILDGQIDGSTQQIIFVTGPDTLYDIGGKIKTEKERNIGTTTTSADDENEFKSFYDETITYKTCGGLDHIPNKLPEFVNAIYKTIKFLIPIILILLGMKDFIQAVMSKDEKLMTEQKNKFIRRISAAVIVFFIFSIVQFITNLAYKAGGEDSESGNISSCMECFLNDSEKCGTMTVEKDNTTQTTTTTQQGGSAGGGGGAW